MEIRISYSQLQLDSAVEFISNNNQSFLGKEEEIRNTIQETMVNMARDPEAMNLGTMGFTLIADREFEGIDSDENVCRIEILVDPSMHLIDELDDFQDKIIDLPMESIRNS
jgi:hypothetical protein